MKKHKYLFLFLIFWILVTIIPASVPMEVPHSLRSLGSLMPLSLLIGWGLASLPTYTTKDTFKRQLTSISLLLILLITFLSFTYSYFVTYPVISQSNWQSNYKDVVDDVFAIRRLKQRTLVLHPDGLIYLWFMAYGPYSGSQFHHWTSSNFKFDQFDQIYFNAKYFDKNNFKYLAIVVGDKELVENYLKRNFDFKVWYCRPVAGKYLSDNIICQKQI